MGTINGGPGLDHTYLAIAPVWKDMSARRQIIFYDQRGTGKSPSATGQRDLTADATVRDLEALRQKLKLDRAAPGSGQKRVEFGKQ